MTKNLPIQDNLAKLLSQSFRLDDPRSGKTPERAKRDAPKPKPKTEVPFHPQRFPSTFSLDTKSRSDDDLPLVQLPKGSEQTIRFSTDVEDQYFDRVTEPGELQIAVLGRSTGGGGGSLTEPRPLTDEKTYINVVKSSPDSGMIRVRMRAHEALNFGEEIRLRATLTRPFGNLEQTFIVRISNPKGKSKKTPPKPEPEDNRLGLPEPVMVYEESAQDGSPRATWEQIEATGQSMDYSVVVRPVAGEDGLEQVLINMDSGALKSFRSGLTTTEQIETADKRYLSAVYFHTLFLYAITKTRGYALQLGDVETGTATEPVDITDYISDLFSTAHAQFLLSFDTQELMAALEA